MECDAHSWSYRLRCYLLLFSVCVRGKGRKRVIQRPHAYIVSNHKAPPGRKEFSLEIEDNI